MLECRAAPRLAAQACLIFAPDAGPEDFATCLARILKSASDRRFVLWMPGARDLSFDERWLLALTRARQTKDRDSETFLLARRTRPSIRPVLCLLLDRLSQGLE
ncbi:hypothetical protein JANAI62_20410 [Jannaschia pagri]|uniref:Uncharacterized protein n=2 Tax=Roseobacteraceae TaxID=2854170 RepID=A0ABQ4NLZ8_9RHOB|nr:hypothetical protein JANAI61_20420 [Jannaschia sp. AI_61]GIT95418.1 hypothetical protein JANAI62_20410 [Jannaschia sp. AI_62]